MQVMLLLEKVRRPGRKSQAGKGESGQNRGAHGVIPECRCIGTVP
jgi:hypothetical protein